MMSFNEFLNFYKKNKKCLGQLQEPKHLLSEKELESRYQKYCKNEDKKSKKIQEKFDKPFEEKDFPIDINWERVYSIVHERDKEYCRLKLVLTKEELIELNKNAPFGLVKILDVAHIIPRSSSKKLYYDENNLVLMNRASHSWLDTYKNPLNGKPITKEERALWWKRVVGEEKYNSLKENK